MSYLQSRGARHVMFSIIAKLCGEHSSHLYTYVTSALKAVSHLDPPKA